MPSPVGHLVAGMAIAWAAEAVRPQRPPAGKPSARSGSPRALTPLVLLCAALALAPDVDILFASHRTFTHSLFAAALVAIVFGAIGRALGAPGVLTGLTCGSVVASHVVLDWLGRDSSTPRGLMALWPLSTSYFYSGIDLFAAISRRYWRPEEFIVQNAIAIARELLILGPPAALAWWLRERQSVARAAKLATRPATTPAAQESDQRPAPSP